MKMNPKQILLERPYPRRHFFRLTGLAAGSFFFPGFQRIGQESWTVGQIMDRFIREVPGAPFRITVDTLKSGSRDTVVTGIVTTMFPTLPVIEKTIALKANFIIVHEPSFYNHLDETNWLENDEVFRYKSALLEKHKIAIWRNHDYIHRHQPDGVMAGVLDDLGWTSRYNEESGIIELEKPMNLKSLIKQLKKDLDISHLRYIGHAAQSCKKILLMPGASGGRRQIDRIGKTKPDVAICGEIQEWETAEYIRDARAKGQPVSLIVLGHIPSEEPGSRYMAQWIRNNIPDLKVTHVPAENPFSYS
jgi:putative NIF3 family GTP cyclohydrolase 1 type 2